MTSLTILLLLLTGFGGGLVGAMLGLGGGILIVPILVLLMNVPMHTAVATSLFCVIATSSAAASRNLIRGIANARLGITLELSTVTGGIAGGLVAGLLPDRGLTLVFGVVILLMTIPMLRGVADEEPEAAVEGADPMTRSTTFAGKMDGVYFDPAEKSEIRYRVRRLPVALTVSGVAGVISGLLGVGGGIVKVPVLTSFCDIPMKAAAATSNFMIGVTAAASAVLYYGRGDVSPLITAATVLGVFAGSRTGARLATKMRGAALRRLFAIVMILMSLQMLLKGAGVLG